VGCDGDGGARGRCPGIQADSPTTALPVACHIARAYHHVAAAAQFDRSATCLSVSGQLEPDCQADASSDYRRVRCHGRIGSTAPFEEFTIGPLAPNPHGQSRRTATPAPVGSRK
jgi:hypothetical protein